MAEFAASIDPFEVRLTGLQLVNATIKGTESGILWLNVEEKEILRQLHNPVHAELTSRFGIVSAPFDGPDYHFYMTVAIGGQPIDTYQKIHDEFLGCLNDLKYTVQELVMFVCDEMYMMYVGYMTYRILPIGNKKS